MSSFRKHWLILVSMVVLVFWWVILPLLAPRDGRFDPSEPIKYWSLITPDRNGFILVTWIAFVAIAIFTSVYAWKHYRGLLFVISWGLIGLGVISSLCIISVLLLLNGDNELQHVQSINFRGRIYQLAINYDSNIWDYTLNKYSVFECDNSGNICTLLISLPPDISQQEPSLILSNDETELLLQEGQTQTRLKP